MSEAIIIHDLLKSTDEKVKRSEELKAIFAEAENDAKGRKKTLRKEVKNLKISTASESWDTKKASRNISIMCFTTKQKID